MPVPLVVLKAQRSEWVFLGETSIWDRDRNRLVGCNTATYKLDHCIETYSEKPRVGQATKNYITL